MIETTRVEHRLVEAPRTALGHKHRCGCSCGWRGVHHATPGEAFREWADHVNRQTAPFMDEHGPFSVPEVSP